MIFSDFLGPADIYEATRAQLVAEIATVLRMRAESVVLRRIVTQDDRREVEIWVELSSEEQLYRAGARLAEHLSAAIRAQFPVDVWVLFRIVPRTHAFLNGQPRGRGVPSFE